MIQKTISRRSFIARSKNLAGGLLLSSFLPIGLQRGIWPLAHAEEFSTQNDHFFVLVRTTGGMDVSYGLDPQILPRGADASDLYVGYTEDKIISAGPGIRLAPAAQALSRYAPDLLVINGIRMENDGHDQLNHYISSGMTDQNEPLLPAKLQSLLGSEDDLGVLADASMASSGALVTNLKDLSSGSYKDLIAMMDTPDSELSSPYQKVIRTLRAQAPQFETMKDTLSEVRSKVSGAPETYSKLAAAISVGLAGFGAVQGNEDTNDLDTHREHDSNQTKGQKIVWENVASLFDTFKAIQWKETGSSLFDRTTFMVVSEFSRGPYLNSQNGKDHNTLTNSVLLAGRGIHGGKTVGGSRLFTRRQLKNGVADQRGVPIDYETGLIARSPENADFIRPENIARTIAKIFGEPKGHTIVNPYTRSIPGIVKLS